MAQHTNIVHREKACKVEKVILLLILFSKKIDKYTNDYEILIVFREFISNQFVKIFQNS